MITVVVTLVKANCTDVVTIIDVVMVTLGKANRTDVVADNVVTDVIAIKVALVKAN